MVPRKLFSAPRMSAGLSVILLAISCIASSQAQIAATDQTSYGFCSGHSSPTQAAQTIYMSNVFSFPASARAGARPAFLQYVKSRDSSVASVNCTMATSQQQAANAKQATENMLQQQVQRSSATAHPLKLVETGWQYQAAATAVTKTTPVTQTATRTITSTTTRRTVPASTSASRTTRTAVPAATSTSTTPISATAPANGVSSIGNTISSTGQNAKQSVTQSVQGIESSTTSTVTDSITSTTTAGQTAIQNKIKGWQDKMFHKTKTDQSTTAPAQGSPQSPANTAAATTPAVAPAASATSANLVSASATAPNAAPRSTIQDEGDGKHSILSIPGQTDARELTLVSGSKNVYIEDATGDKYIVMPNGEITHIPHKNSAK